MSRALKRPQALIDVDEQARWIADDNPDAARRFRKAVEQTLEVLAAMPGMGVGRRYRDPALAGLRMHPVTGFPERLLFYLPLPDGVELVRVLHGRRDIARLFDLGPGPGDGGEG
jgi:toxin ParE1/3/4